MFITSNQTNSNRKLHFPLTNSISLVYLPRNAKKFQTDQSIPHVFSLCKETTHKPLKAAVPKTLFSSVCVIGKSCFDECFLVHVIVGRHYF